MTTLPPQLRVVVRDWLCANHIILSSSDATVLIDTGYVSRVPHTLRLLEEELEGKPVDLLVNTHCHSDHMGGNAGVQRRYGCSTLIPEGEAPLIRAWDQHALWLAQTDQEAERFEFDGALEAGATYRWGDLEWRAIAAPGHDPGALIFYCEQEQILISGDALWEHGFGIVMPETPNGMRDARRTLEVIGALDVRLVIPGHGKPFADVHAALERSLARARALEEDTTRMARAVLKALFSFILLDRGQMQIAELPDYFQRVDIYREYNARYFGLAPVQFAAMMLTELERSGAVRRENGNVLPR